MNAIQPTGSGDMEGKIAVKFKDPQSLVSLCEKMFETFDADAHEPIALRLFYGRELILTLYALDKIRQENSSDHTEKLPVRKFKKMIGSAADLLPFIHELNFTLQAGNFPLEDLEVVNK